ncbi:hypothetical protein R1flu_019688 [Riccia fluitans]|uniref:Uncharacterized protein n=1 Tax=Riccia fluitans TaxID=41844 RepID=A0ABD1ZKT2_9MARC
MHPDQANKLVYVHFNKNISSVHSKTQRKSIRMINKYLRSKAQHQLLTSKFTDGYGGKIFGVDLSKWLRKEEVKEDLNEDIIDKFGKTTTKNEQLGDQSEKGKAIKLFRDNLEDDDFLSDIDEGEEVLSEDEFDMPLRRHYAIGATLDRKDTLSPILLDEIGDDDTLDMSLPRLILNEPYNIPRDHSLAQLYKHYGTSKEACMNEKQHKRKRKVDAEAETLNQKQKVQEKIDMLLGMNTVDHPGSSNPIPHTMLVESRVRRTLK